MESFAWIRQYTVEPNAAIFFHLPEVAVQLVPFIHFFPALFVLLLTSTPLEKSGVPEN